MVRMFGIEPPHPLLGKDVLSKNIHAIVGKIVNMTSKLLWCGFVSQNIANVVMVGGIEDTDASSRFGGSKEYPGFLGMSDALKKTDQSNQHPQGSTLHHGHHLSPLARVGVSNLVWFNTGLRYRVK